MRRLVPLAIVAALSSLATAAAIALPALADDDRRERSAREQSGRPFEERFERFAACMRRHGFDFGDDTTVRLGPDGVTVNGKEVDADSFRRAERDCGGPPFGGLGRGLRGLPGLEGLPDREDLATQRDAYLADVARRLGVSTDRLKDALRDAAVARIDKLERTGDIDEIHADMLRELARAGGFPLLGGPLLHRWPRLRLPGSGRGEDGLRWRVRPRSTT